MHGCLFRSLSKSSMHNNAGLCSGIYGGPLRDFECALKIYMEGEIWFCPEERRQRVKVVYCWFEEGSNFASREVTAVFYFKSGVTISKAARHALRHSPVDVAQVDWSRKVLMLDSKTRLGALSGTVGEVFSHCDYQSSPDIGSGQGRSQDEAVLYICKDSGFFKRKTKTELLILGITVLIIIIVLAWSNELLTFTNWSPSKIRI